MAGETHLKPVSGLRTFLRYPVNFLSRIFEVCALGFCVSTIFIFHEFRSFNTPFKSLILAMESSVPLTLYAALYGFYLFPLAIYNYVGGVLVLAFKFETDICRSDGDFWDTWLSYQIAFATAVYAVILLVSIYRRNRTGHQTKTSRTWVISLSIAAAILLLIEVLLPSSMADCFGS
jgi:hypothetical protein